MLRLLPVMPPSTRCPAASLRPPGGAGGGVVAPESPPAPEGALGGDVAAEPRRCRSRWPRRSRRRRRRGRCHRRRCHPPRPCRGAVGSAVACDVAGPGVATPTATARMGVGVALPPSPLLRVGSAFEYEPPLPVFWALITLASPPADGVVAVGGGVGVAAADQADGVTAHIGRGVLPAADRRRWWHCRATWRRRRNVVAGVAADVLESRRVGSRGVDPVVQLVQLELVLLGGLVGAVAVVGDSGWVADRRRWTALFE